MIGKEQPALSFKQPPAGKPGAKPPAGTGAAAVAPLDAGAAEHDNVCAAETDGASDADHRPRVRELPHADVDYNEPSEVGSYSDREDDERGPIVLGAHYPGATVVFSARSSEWVPCWPIGYIRSPSPVPPADPCTEPALS